MAENEEIIIDTLEGLTSHISAVRANARRLGAFEGHGTPEEVGYEAALFVNEINNLYPWLGAPPQLPGSDPRQQDHYARGWKTGPLYVSPNILQTDSPWVKLAYMRYPLSRENLTALLKEIVPSARLKHFQRERTMDEFWMAEVIAIDKLIEDDDHELFDGEFTEQEASELFRAIKAWPVLGKSTHGGETLIERWRNFQKLTISVLWVWGTRHDHPLRASYCFWLTGIVAEVYQETHPLEARISTEMEYRESEVMLQRLVDWAKLEADRTAVQKGSMTVWQKREKLPSVARIVQGLYDVIGTAGGILIECRRCGRLAERVRRREFCSDHCRALFAQERARLKTKPVEA